MSFLSGRAVSSLVQPTFLDQAVQRTERLSGERSIQPGRQPSPLGTFVSSLSANVPGDQMLAPPQSVPSSLQLRQRSARISQFQSEDVPRQDPLSFLNTLVQPLVQCGDRLFGPASCHSVRSRLPEATMASTSSCSDSGDRSVNPPFHLAPAAQPNVHRYIPSSRRELEQAGKDRQQREGESCQADLSSRQITNARLAWKLQHVFLPSLWKKMRGNTWARKNVRAQHLKNFVPTRNNCQSTS
jgi:hypothetical protein